MRYAFGLVGLLVGFGIIIWLMSDNAASVIDARKKIDPELKQIAGRSEDGTPAGQSASFQAQTDSSGKFRGLLVTGVTPGGAFDQHFGLRQFDLVVQVGPIDLRTQDEGMAQAMMAEAFQRNQEIIVVRGTDHLTLPQAPAKASPSPAGAPAASNTPPPPPPKSRGLQGQLESIQQGVPTH